MKIRYRKSIELNHPLVYFKITTEFDFILKICFGIQVSTMSVSISDGRLRENK